jgi:hypothetical protein
LGKWPLIYFIFLVQMTSLLFSFVLIFFYFLILPCIYDILKIKYLIYYILLRRRTNTKGYLSLNLVSWPVSTIDEFLILIGNVLEQEKIFTQSRLTLLSFWLFPWGNSCTIFFEWTVNILQVNITNNCTLVILNMNFILECIYKSLF